MWLHFGRLLDVDHRRLLRHVLAVIPANEAAHGCVKQRSVATALEPHVGANVVIRIDLEDIFATISGPRVRGILLTSGLPAPVATLIAGLCTTVVPLQVWSELPRPQGVVELDAHRRFGERLRVPHLPHGAPTSPALANAVCFQLDRRLSGLAGRHGAQSPGTSTI